MTPPCGVINDHLGDMKHHLGAWTISDGENIECPYFYVIKIKKSMLLIFMFVNGSISLLYCTNMVQY